MAGHTLTQKDRDKGNATRKARTATQKKQMLDALKTTFGLVKPAAEKAGIERSTHWRWVNEDQDYAKTVLEIQENNLDFVEMNMYKQIAEGNHTLIMYVLNNKGSARGYGKRLLEMGVGTTQELADIPKIVWVKSE
jgi:hypothetical protein